MSTRNSITVWLASKMPDPLQLSGAGKTAVGVFRKDVLRAGKYAHPKAGWSASWTDEDLSRFVETFNQMKANGYDVEVTKDHSHRADDVIGYVTSLEVENSTLYANMEIRGETALDLVSRVRNVSVEIAPSVVDGSGRKYGASIVAVSVVQKPIVTGQGEFVRAASLNAGVPDADMGILIGSGRLIEPANGDREMDMTKLLSAVGKAIGKDITEQNAEAELTKYSAAQTEAKRQADAHKASADALQSKVAALETQIKTMSVQSYSALSEPAREAIDMRAEAIEERIESLIGKTITVDADTVKLLSSAILGDSTSRNVLLLSKSTDGKVAARTIVDGLCEKAKSMTTRYSVPASGESENDDLDKVVKEMSAMAAGAAKS